MYEFRNGYTVRMKGSEEDILCNFEAEIVAETTYHGGITPGKTLRIKGRRADSTAKDGVADLPEIAIDSDEFAGLAWVTRHWGIGCIIMPGSGVKEDIRTAIQFRSQPAKSDVYKHTGWADLTDGRRAYLHRGGAITAKGNDPKISVELPSELRYDLRCSAEPKMCIAATLELTRLTRPDLTWPLLAATLAPLYGPVDFAVHVTGRTGSFKSEVMSLFQSHYGPEMDARHLPGSWSSSDNALEALAFLSKNAAFVIDDFVPHGSTYQQKAYQGKAERIFRSQGNQSGRQRLTDVSSMQQTMYPRGCVLSTGEDTPEGHSVRGRMLVREIQAGEVTPSKLTTAQANRKLYCGTVAWLAQQLAASPIDLTERSNLIRDELIDIGHSRTPSTLGRMIAVCEDFINRCLEAKVIDQKAARHLDKEMTDAIVAAGKEQAAMLESSDPVQVMFSTLRQMFAQGVAHIRSVTGGIPTFAEQMGWTAEASSHDDIKQYKARGVCLGWSSAKKNELYLDPNVAIPAIKKAAGSEIPLSKQTLLKRIHEAGLLKKRDDVRSRYTTRVTCEGAVRQVLVLNLKESLELESGQKEE